MQILIAQMKRKMEIAIYGDSDRDNKQMEQNEMKKEREKQNGKYAFFCFTLRSVSF